MGDVIRRYPLISYFVIAYAGSWAVWALFVLSLEGSGLLPFHAPCELSGVDRDRHVFGADRERACRDGRHRGPGGHCPPASANRAVARGPRLVPVRVRRPSGIETLGTIAIPGALASVTPIDLLPELMSAAVFFVYPALLAGPLGEEIGWRGVALPRLQQLHGPVKASLILGVLWAFWHAPIWFSGQWSTPSVPNIAVYVFWIVAVTFIFTWVFNNTRGSVFMAILLHGTMDVFPNAFLLAHLPGAAEMTSSGALSMYWGLALGFGLFALLLVIFTRGRLGKQYGPG